MCVLQVVTECIYKIAVAQEEEIYDSKGAGGQRTFLKKGTI